MDGISRETFKEMDTDSKLNVLFDYAVDAHKTAVIAHDIAEKLDKRVSGGHRADMLLAGTMGFIGGVVGFIGKAIFGR